MIEITETAPPELDRLRQRALILGIIGAVLSLAGAVFNLAAFFRSYLLAFMFWAGIALGSLAILMVQHMSGGAWGIMIRRVLESSTRTFPLIALFFIPVAVGIPFLYIWSDPHVVASNPHLEHKAHYYLNVPFFLARAVVYFAAWFFLANMLNKLSLEQDRTGDKGLIRSMQTISGPGLVLFGATVTFASVDWVMSLEPEWFSTIYGILFMGSQALTAMAFTIAVIVLLSSWEPMASLLQPRHLHDLGKLMLAFIMLWAYFHLSQFLIIWSGNLPEETPWYIRRMNGGWQYVGLAILLFHFVLPFVMLLSRDLKRNARLIAVVAGLIFVMRFVDLSWIILPAYGEHDGGAGLASWLYYPMAIVAAAGLGGLWLAYFLFQLKKRPLLPVRDPNLENALAHTGGH
ncbi:MAG TPA: hypothetical protein VKC34_18220 [Blastocatellia bacterium]|nr:hypothetical protein [Blastocatellia bacterium]